jgi:hypothetical protein
VKPAGLLLALLAAGILAAAGPQGGDWLDAKKVVGWNRAGAAIPKAPSTDADPLGKGRCKDETIPATGPEEQQVVAGGWNLLPQTRQLGETVLVLGSAGGDGMCRPLNIQAFFFVKAKFAGTLAPRPVDSRSDGVFEEAKLGNRSVTVSFRRYTDDDPLCCPSRSSDVVYRVEEGGAGPVAVPVSVKTRKLPAQ